MDRMTELRQLRRPLAVSSAAVALGAALAMAPVGSAKAAKSDGCEGGGFSVIAGSKTIATDGETTLPASQVGQRFLVKGKYVEFTVVGASFAVENWTLTGAANPEDLTGASARRSSPARLRTIAASS